MYPHHKISVSVLIAVLLLYCLIWKCLSCQFWPHPPSRLFYWRGSWKEKFQHFFNQSEGERRGNFKTRNRYRQKTRPRNKPPRKRKPSSMFLDAPTLSRVSFSQVPRCPGTDARVRQMPGCQVARMTFAWVARVPSHHVSA